MITSPMNLFLQYGSRTTMHGWSQVYHSTNVKQRCFWFLLSILGALATTLHVYKTLVTYFDTPVNSRKLMGTIDSFFPDVTICNSEMIPNVILAHDQGKAFLKHLQHKYNMFRKVLVHRFNNHSGQPIKASKPSDIVDMLRKDDWQTVNNLFTSEDTSHISVPLRTFILKCDFMRLGKNCAETHWTLVQNSRYGNCYTFRADLSKRAPLSNDPSYGLVVYLYVGDFSIQKIFNQKNGFQDLSLIDGVPSTDRFSKSQADYPEFVRILNYLHPPNGIRLLIHERNTFPDVRSKGFDVASGQFADIKFTMELISLVNHKSRPCNSGNAEKRQTRVLRGFKRENELITPLWEFYRNSTELCVSLQLQKLMFQTCGCYTHLYPSQERPEKYCFHVPYNLTDPSPIRRRITCHNAQATLFSRKVPGINKECIKERPCKYNFYHLGTVLNPWPSINNIHDLMTFTIIPKLKDVKIQLKNSLDHDNSVKPFAPLEHIILGNNTHWRTVEEVIRKNFIKVRVFPDSVTGNEHLEVPSYHFAEALSEIGGIFGLWAGMSILTFFEFIELIILIVMTCGKSFKSRWYRNHHQPVQSNFNEYMMTAVNECH